MNIRLKTAIISKYRFQRDCALKAGMSEDRLSRIIHGKTEPSPDEKKQIAEALETTPEQIFLIKNL